MRVVVPFAVETPKTRLSDVLDPDERREFARAMLDDVLVALREIGTEPEVLATAEFESDAPVTVDDRPLTEAVNGVLADAESDVVVVMADLALATPHALARLFDAPGDVVFAPGRGGGTNALLSRHPSFRVDYHGASYLDHRRNARDVGATVETVDSHRLATDIDEPADLAELLIHGDGEARKWLESAGFELVTDDGRVEVERTR